MDVEFTNQFQIVRTPWTWPFWYLEQQTEKGEWVRVKRSVSMTRRQAMRKAMRVEDAVVSRREVADRFAVQPRDGTGRVKSLTARNIGFAPKDKENEDDRATELPTAGDE